MADDLGPVGEPGRPAPGEAPVLWDPLGTWPKARRALWLAVAIVVCLTRGPLFLGGLRLPPDTLTDFVQEWASARNVLEGRPVYEDLETSVPRHFGRLDPSSVMVEVNAHPPTSVLLALPLAPLDYFDAHVVWNLISLAALGASVAIVARQLAIPLSAWSAVPILALSLGCFPLLFQTWLGQLNLVLLLLLTGAWAADRSDRPRLAGALLGLATSIKLFPGYLLLYFAVRRRWTVVGWALVSLALLTGLTMIVEGPEAYRAYVFDALPRVSRFQAGWANSSLTGLCRKLFGPEMQGKWLIWRTEPLWPSATLGRVVPPVLIAGLAGVVALISRRVRSRAEADLAFGLAITAMLLSSPITWEHYLLLLLVPLAVAWVRLPRTAWARAMLGAIVVVIWLPPQTLARVLMPWAAEGVAGPALALGPLSLQTYALIGLFILSLLELRACPQEATAPAEDAGSSTVAETVPGPAGLVGAWAE